MSLKKVKKKTVFEKNIWKQGVFEMEQLVCSGRKWANSFILPGRGGYAPNRHQSLSICKRHENYANQRE